MKAIIVAAGRGSRFYPYSDDKPKCLTPYKNSTILQYQIDTLRSVGIEDIVIVSGYKNELMIFEDTTKVVNPNWGTTNMVDSLFCAEEYFGDDFIMCYSDIVYNKTVINKLLNSREDISVIVDKDWLSYWKLRSDDPLEDTESLKIKDGLIVNIGQKVKSLNEPQGQFIGLLRFKNNGVNALKLTKSRKYTTDMLTEMIDNGNAIHPVFINGGWCEFDTPRDYSVNTTRWI